MNLPFETTTAALDSAPIRFAGFWIRSAAFLIDFLLLNLAEFALTYAISHALGLDPMAEQILDSFLTIAFYVYYYLFFQVKHQTTLGKRWLGLRLVHSGTLGPISRGQAALRLVGYVLSFVMLGCGFLMVAFHPEKRGFHDLISRTFVVRA